MSYTTANGVASNILTAQDARKVSVVGRELYCAGPTFYGGALLGVGVNLVGPVGE